MISKLLVANRGEIACRIIKTAKQLGISTVAIYSDADRNAKHVQMADDAFYIGQSTPSESYLQGDKIIKIAIIHDVDAIHPGYGFLSENAEFARLCHQKKIKFVGPSAKAIEAMGSKSAAKMIMSKAGVPLVTGYHGDEQTNGHLIKQATKIGFPLLIKAVFGGGGKGMRIIEFDDDLVGVIDSAKREALSAFGNDKLLLERYLKCPRHIEVQVFADAHGNCVYLGDRDCSVQRRYQKIIEEAPAPNLSDALREKMGMAAVAAAKAINYVGAGTIEFLLDANGQDFFFMEMNTRLQVEHPVTEMITGQDLVAWQILVANGEALPLTQGDICIKGHAFEARIYAEDPSNGFLPASGKLDCYKPPLETTNVRVDSGVDQGDEISNFYDPMIAKLICWDNSREKALQRLVDSLIDFHILGIKHNIGFLKGIASHSSFKFDKVATDFIEKYSDDLFADKVINDSSQQQIYALAILFIFLNQKKEVGNSKYLMGDPDSPWHSLNNFRLNQELQCDIEFWNEQKRYFNFKIAINDNVLQTIIDEESFEISGYIDNQNQILANINGHQFITSFHLSNGEFTLFIDGESYSFSVNRPQQDNHQATQASDLNAPMNGTIVTHLVQKFETVTQGQGLMVMEAMKMEYTIHAPSDGKVKDFYFHPGELVSDGSLLLEFEESLAN